VATPLNKYVRYITRSIAQGLIYSFPKPKFFYRRRLHHLLLRRLLEIIGEEALTDIQFLFQTNNQPSVNNPTNTPNPTMSVFLRHLNFAAIQGAPHQVPEKAIDKLPTF
jgi:hypothetical protein